jgi:hypothetical protein
MRSKIVDGSSPMVLGIRLPHAPSGPVLATEETAIVLITAVR